MRFQFPIALAALLVVPVLVLAYLIRERSRVRAARRFASPAMLPVVAPSASGPRRHVAPLLLLLAFVVLLVALAGPELRLSVARERATVMLVVDASRSMDATDVAPSRMGAARAAARSFLEELPEPIPVGAVAFSGTARLLVPPTLDRAELLRSLDALETSRGTLIGDGVAEAVATVRDEWRRDGRAPAVALLLSDGNDTGSEIPPAEAAAMAERSGIPVHSVALGDLEGTSTEHKPPNAALLRSIAEASSGTFAAAPTADALERVYAELGSRVGTRVEWAEITVAFVGVALAVAVAAVALALRWFRRPA